MNVFVYSFLSQLLFSISLFIQVFAFKESLSSLKDLFTSIFLNFMGIVPFSINGWASENGQLQKYQQMHQSMIS